MKVKESNKSSYFFMNLVKCKYRHVDKGATFGLDSNLFFLLMEGAYC